MIIQSIGFHNITLILIDDQSSDGSRETVENYSRMYKNIVSVLLHENTGTPAFPRNLGAHLSNSTYLFYLDADDWLHREGVLTLFEILEDTGGSYAVGKTIQVDPKGETVIGRYESSRERRDVSPFDIKHLFYHLGPRARMMRSDLIKENEILYPEMKFAEDKQFFIDVILAAGTISTTTRPIYYLNRIDNNESLTKQTNYMEKMDSNIKVIKHVLDKNLPPEKEKPIINRLIEFDAITRMFDRNHFLKTKEKHDYYKKFHETVHLFNKAKRSYSLEETLIKPINQLYYTLAIDEEYSKLEKLAHWSKKEDDGSIEMINGKPFKVLHLEHGEQLQIPVGVKSELIELEKAEEDIALTFQLCGNNIPDVEGIRLTGRTSVLNTTDITPKIEQSEDGRVTMRIHTTDLQLPVDGYIFKLIHSDYESIMVSTKLAEKNTLPLIQGKQAIFYTTINGNISLKIKEA